MPLANFYVRLVRNIIVSLSLLTLIPLKVSGLMMVVQTSSGMHLQGELVSVRGKQLTITTTGQSSRETIGIPLEGISAIQVPESRFDQAYDPLPKNLIPYLDFTTQGKFLKWIEDLGQEGHWVKAWEWAGFMEEASRSREIKLRSSLIKAHGLYEMKLYGELAIALENLNGKFDPLNAPELLCWLNAVSEFDRDNKASALFWAELPALRVGPPDPEIAENCRQLAASIRHQIPDTLPLP